MDDTFKFENLNMINSLPYEEASQQQPAKEANNNGSEDHIQIDRIGDIIVESRQVDIHYEAATTELLASQTYMVANLMMSTDVS